MMGPGVVARCSVCEQVVLRLVTAGPHLLLDARGLKYLCVDTSRSQESNNP